MGSVAHARALTDSGAEVKGVVVLEMIGYFRFSDHRGYWNEGMKAVMVTDSAFLRNPAYPTESGRPENLDSVPMAYVVDGVFSALMAR